MKRGPANTGPRWLLCEASLRAYRRARSRSLASLRSFFLRAFRARAASFRFRFTLGFS